MARCESMVALPAGRVERCPLLATHAIGWREVCYRHFVASFHQPDLKSASQSLSPRDREAIGLGWGLSDEQRFRDVLVAIINAPDDDIHPTTEVP